MAECNNYEHNIKTIAVLDLETNDLPFHQFNKCGITELCIYAFSSSCLKESRKDFLLNNATLENQKSLTTMEGIDEMNNVKAVVPKLPRVLHKLTLMINPRRLIAVEAEKITGLNNEMLCEERHFDENTGDLLMKFLNRLQRPICLVAHNGLRFDFPIIRYVLDNINLKMIPNVLCVDSYKAIPSIDYTIRNLYEQQKPSTKTTYFDDNDADFDAILCANDNINWQMINETTPKKCTRFSKDHDNCHTPTNSTPEKKSDSSAKRSLFKSQKTPRAPKGFYVLGNIYKRIFQEKCPNSHSSEGDVIALSKLILHYGRDFLDYAMLNAVEFQSVKRLGS